MSKCCRQPATPAWSTSARPLGGYTHLGQTGTCYLAAGVFALAQGLLALGMVFYARDVAALSPAAVGWLVAAYMLVFVGACLGGRFAGPRVAPLPKVAAVTLALSVATGVLALTRRPAAVFALYALCGGLTGLFWPTLSGWLSQGREGQVLGRTVSLYNLSWSAGTVVGPLACGWLTERSVYLPLPAAAALFLVTALFLGGAWRRLPGAGSPAGGVPIAAPSGERSGPGTGGTPLRFSGWGGGGVLFFAVGVFGYIFPMAAREQMGLAEGVIGLILLLRALSNTAMFMLLSRTAFWQFRTWPMVAGQLLAAAVCLALPGAHTAPAIGVWFFLFGVSSAIAYANSQFLGVSDSTNRAWRMAVHDATLSAGMMAGTVAGGRLYQSWGMPAAYGLCGALLAVSAAAQAAWGARVRRRAAGARCPGGQP